jgi:DNA gyrase subunit B
VPKTKASNSGVYNAANITVLSDIESVQKNPGVYINSLDSYGMWVCVREIIDNARDEATAGFATKVTVYRKDDFTFRVVDDGRGIPVDMHPQHKKPAIELVFCKLNAGGKMSHGENAAYKKATSGVHGMGASIVNAMSSKLTAHTYRNSKRAHVFTCNHGIPAGPLQQVVANDSLTGTEVEFTLDAKRFDAGSFVEDKTIIDYLSLQADLYHGIEFTYHNGSTQTTFKNKHTIAHKLAAACNLDAKAVLHARDDHVNMALCLSPDQPIKNAMYVCGMPSTEGGTHWQGLIKAIDQALIGFTKKDVAETFAECVSGILNLEIDNPKFKGQVKQQLKSREAVDIVYNSLHAKLRKFFMQHKAEVAEVIKKAEALVEMRKKHRNEEELTRTVNGNGKNKLNLPAKAVVCPNAKPELRELFICEGESALGTCEEARFKTHQEILPLTGKVLNVVRNTDKAVNNVSVKDILSMIGYNANDPNMLNSRVRGKIIILTDADADGGHIQLLLIGLLHKYFPRAFELGMVYVLNTPLYEYKSATELAYGNTLGEIKAQLKHFDPTCVKRMKGWGSCSAKSLREIAFSDKRELIRVLPLDDAGQPVFLGLLSSDPKMRREMLDYDSSTSNFTPTDEPVKNDRVKEGGKKHVARREHFIRSKNLARQRLSADIDLALTAII